MGNLSEQLAAIGIPEPSQIAPPVHETPADVVLSTVLAYIRSGTGDPITGHELLATLRMMTARLETTLADSGCSITLIAPPPKVAVKRRTHRIVKNEDGDSVAMPHEYTVQEKCEHKLVYVSEEAAEVTCRTCGMLVNAAWWMARHTEQITRMENWRHQLALDRKRLEGEIADAKAELSRTKQANKRAKQTSAKQALRADGSDYLIPPSPKRKRAPKS